MLLFQTTMNTHSDWTAAGAGLGCSWAGQLGAWVTLFVVEIISIFEIEKLLENYIKGTVSWKLKGL